MNENQNWLENELEEMSKRLAYPPTPDLVNAVLARRSAKRVLRLTPLARVALVLLLLLILGIALVPPVRAAILNALHLGAAEILPADQAPTNVTPIASVLELPNQTTLREAQAKVRLRLEVPSYPPDLGDPAFVFLSNDTSPIVTLVWMEGDQVSMSLHMYGTQNYFRKYSGEDARATRVNGFRALWLTKPHLYQEFYQNFEDDPTASLSRQVEMNVLLWDALTTTYRLEIRLPLDEAIKVAESLQPLE